MQTEMAKIKEETEEDDDNADYSYHPRLHEWKRGLYKNQVKQNASSVSVTNMNDATADNMMVINDNESKESESMMRPPGPPIGSIVYGHTYFMPNKLSLESRFASPGQSRFVSPSVTGRSNAQLISSKRSSVALNDEPILDRNIDMSVFGDRSGGLLPPIRNAQPRMAVFNSGFGDSRDPQVDHHHQRRVRDH